MMNISNNGVALIKSFEGCRLTAYKAVPTEQYWTIGWGDYGAHVKQGMTITQAQADKTFLEKLQLYVNGVNGCLKVTVNQNQFDALVSFAYNCGVAALQKSTLLKRVNKGNMEAAADEFLNWTKSGGVVLKGLETRRKKEADLFMTPVVSSDKPVNPLQPSEVDFILSIMQKYSKDMSGNKPIQTYTDLVINRIKSVYKVTK